MWLSRNRRPHAALKMAYDAIRMKRSPKQAFILLVGLSGSGKSSSINYLFGRNIVPTSDTRSETRSSMEFSVTLKSTEWKIKDLTLSIIDTPGFCDTDGLEQDARNMVSIEQFLVNHPFLGKYFPNLVVIVHNIQDNRSDGLNSHFSKMLRCVAQIKAVDQNNPNVVVVLTHAASIARSKARWIEKVDKRVTELGAIVESYLGITPEIVVQENEPNDFDLEESGDWHLLPDGTQQPKQLFLTCKSILNTSKDELGHEALAVCFRPGNLIGIKPGLEVKASAAREEDVKKMHAALLQNVTVVSESEINHMFDNYNQETNIAKLNNDILILKVRLRDMNLRDAKDIQSMSMNQLKGRLLPIHMTSKMEKIITDVFGIQYEQAGHLECYVGMGYNILADKPTCTWPFEMDTSAKGMLGLPLNVFVTESRNYTVLCRSGLSRDEYVKERLASVGVSFETGSFNGSVFSMNVRSGYNIKDTSSSEHTATETSFQVEQKMYKVAIKSRTISSDLKKDIQNLPDSYNTVDEINVAKWKAFFTKWGYHAILGSYYGGSISGKVKHESEDSNTTKSAEAYLGMKLAFLQSKFEFDFKAKKLSASQETHSMSSTSLEWLGGDTSLYKNSLDNIGIEDWQKWVDSLPYSPAPLHTSFQLYPLYLLVLDVDEKKGLEMQKVVSLLLKGKFEFEGVDDRTTISASNKSDGGCFCRDGIIFQQGGKRKRMKDIKIGDHVLSVGQDRQLVQDKVIAWIHKCENTHFPFLEIHHRKGIMVISSDHIVFVGMGRQPLPASKIVEGDELVFVEGQDKFSYVLSPVTSIQKTYCRGLYAPLTKSGKLIVDGVLVSCYCNANTVSLLGRKLPFSHRVAHFVFSPLRLADKLGLHNINSKTNIRTGLHVYAKWLIDHVVTCKNE